MQDEEGIAGGDVEETGAGESVEEGVGATEEWNPTNNCAIRSPEAEQVPRCSLAALYLLGRSINESVQQTIIFTKRTSKELRRDTVTRGVHQGLAKERTAKMWLVACRVGGRGQGHGRRKKCTNERKAKRGSLERGRPVERSDCRYRILRDGLWSAKTMSRACSNLPRITKGILKNRLLDGGEHQSDL